MMIVKDRIATLQAFYINAVNQAFNSLEINVMLDDRHPLINNHEKDLTRKERTTLAQLRSGHSRLLGSYKSRIKKDASLYVCADCGKTPHDVNHLFNCPAVTTLTPSDLWSRPIDVIRDSTISRPEDQGKMRTTTTYIYKLWKYTHAHMRTRPVSRGKLLQL